MNKYCPINGSKSQSLLHEGWWELLSSARSAAEGCSHTAHGSGLTSRFWYKFWRGMTVPLGWLSTLNHQKRLEENNRGWSTVTRDTGQGAARPFGVQVRRVSISDVGEQEKTQSITFEVSSTQKAMSISEDKNCSGNSPSISQGTIRALQEICH